jgi:hypothetical protein
VHDIRRKPDCKKPFFFTQKQIYVVFNFSDWVSGGGVRTVSSDLSKHQERGQSEAALETNAAGQDRHH